MLLLDPKVLSRHLTIPCRNAFSQDSPSPYSNTRRANLHVTNLGTIETGRKAPESVTKIEWILDISQKMSTFLIPDIDHCTSHIWIYKESDEYQMGKWSFHCQKRSVITISTTLDQ